MTGRACPRTFFQRMSHEFGERDKTCRCSHAHFDFEGTANWTRSRGGTRQRAHPHRLRQRRHDHHATRCAQKRRQLQLASASSRHGRSLPKTPPRFFKTATAGESSGDEFGILEDDRCIDTGVCQRRHLVHELVFACSPPAPRHLQISHTILTQADWCAVRAVACCEQGLLPVVTTVSRDPECFGAGRYLGLHCQDCCD